MLKFLALMILGLSALADEAHPTLKIGSQAPDFSLPGTDGQTHTLSDYSSSRVLAILFTSNHCPMAQMHENRINKLVVDYRDKGVALVAINPNSPAGIMVSEHRFTDVGETLDGCKIHAAFRRFNFPYLYDGDNETVAQAYGPVATPHIFIFDQQRKLRYEGQIDDNLHESLVKTQDARNAIDALLAGKPVPLAHTEVIGSSIKWKEKEGLRRTELASMNSEQVDITWNFETPDDLKQLHNNPAHQLLLVTFWAASSAPSIEQLSNIVTIYRMYRSRGLKVVTVALNPTDEKLAPEAVLKKEHASMKNLQIAFATRSATEAAFDPGWDGTVPFTVVIAPDGKVLYRQPGKADDLQLRRLVLANLPSMRFHGDVSTDPDELRAYWQGK